MSEISANSCKGKNPKTKWVRNDPYAARYWDWWPRVHYFCKECAAHSCQYYFDKHFDRPMQVPILRPKYV